MSYNTKANTVTHDVTHTFKKPNIDHKDDYSYTQCWEENIINSGINMERF